MDPMRIALDADSHVRSAYGRFFAMVKAALPLGWRLDEVIEHSSSMWLVVGGGDDDRASRECREVKMKVFWREPGSVRWGTLQLVADPESGARWTARRRLVRSPKGAAEMWTTQEGTAEGDGLAALLARLALEAE